MDDKLLGIWKKDMKILKEVKVKWFLCEFGEGVVVGGCLGNMCLREYTRYEILMYGCGYIILCIIKKVKYKLWYVINCGFIRF